MFMCVRRAEKMNLAAAFAICVLLAGCGGQSVGWQKKLADELAVFGHRNWILVADSAYPAQSRVGIETVATGQDHIEVVKKVLSAVDAAPHVRAVVYLDAEMQYVSEKDAPGIEACRRQLASLLGQRQINSLPHEQLIARLDESAKTFSVLVLKTNLTLPYTSVFIELDCGYWTGDAERRLRQAVPSR